MVIVQLMGGLGNQLQQYALYRKFISMGVDARLDTSWFRPEVQENMRAPRALELDYLEGIKYTAATEQEVKAVRGYGFEEFSDSLVSKVKRHLMPHVFKAMGQRYRIFEESSIYHPELLELKNAYISGFYACEYYYADILPTLREEIKFPINSERSEDLYTIVLDMNKTESISLHLRRGDYEDPGNQEMFGGICTEEYYKGAIEYCLEKLSYRKADGNVGNTAVRDHGYEGDDGYEGRDESSEVVKPLTFFVFSDDGDYAVEFAHKCAKEYGVPFRVVDINRGKYSYLDMYLMSKCNHNITANSTFSFWGARFNDYENRIMIRPTKHKNSQQFVKEDMEKWWAGWTFVDPNGARM